MRNNINISCGIKETAIHEKSANAVPSTHIGVKSQFKGAPANDTFESAKKKNLWKTLSIILMSLFAAIGGSLLLLARKGGKTLGKDAKLGEKIEQGWREVFQGKKVKDKGNNNPSNNNPDNPTTPNNKNPQHETYDKQTDLRLTDTQKESTPPVNRTSGANVVVPNDTANWQRAGMSIDFDNKRMWLNPPDDEVMQFFAYTETGNNQAKLSVRNDLKNESIGCLQMYFANKDVEKLGLTINDPSSNVSLTYQGKINVEVLEEGLITITQKTKRGVFFEVNKPLKLKFTVAE